jgi:hypothetical protein
MAHTAVSPFLNRTGRCILISRGATGPSIRAFVPSPRDEHARGRRLTCHHGGTPYDRIPHECGRFETRQVWLVSWEISLISQKIPCSLWHTHSIWTDCCASRIGIATIQILVYVLPRYGRTLPSGCGRSSMRSRNTVISDSFMSVLGSC